MDPISDGCRLCLDPSAECFTTIDNPQLKDQMKKVFCFSLHCSNVRPPIVVPDEREMMTLVGAQAGGSLNFMVIEPKRGLCSSVCPSCAYAISEFYQYSQKVCQNQEVLNGNVTNCDPIVDLKITISDPGLSVMTENSCEPKDDLSKEKEVPNNNPEITLERIKVETLSDSELPETTEPNNEISENEEDPSSGEDELYEPPSRKGRTEKNKLDDVERDEPSKNSKQTMTEIQQKRKEENQLFNKHFRMVCELCGRSASTLIALHRHFRKEHKLKGWILCCNTKLFSRSALLDHIDLHTNPDAFRCEVCGRKYRHQAALNEHKLRKHSREDQRTFKCDICPQSFALKHDFNNHTMRHEKFKCPKCEKTFTNKRNYNAHMMNKHGDIDGTIVCTICEKGFVSKETSDRHMNEHMGIEVERVQCEICQNWLKDNRILRQHMKTVHADGDRKFQCDICLKKYRHIRALRDHIRTVHAEPTHECNFCGKKFREAKVLREHRTTHTGETLYTCEYCGLRIKLRTTWRLHMKREHPVEWAQKKKTVKNLEQS